MSVMVTNPEAMRQRAPMWLEAWTDWLSMRPDVAAEWRQATSLATDPGAAKRRIARLQAGFRRNEAMKQDELEKKALKGGWRARTRELLHSVTEHLMEKYWVPYDYGNRAVALARAKSVTLRAEDLPRYFLSAGRYIDNQNTCTRPGRRRKSGGRWNRRA
jgi:hypothetical protein